LMLDPEGHAPIPRTLREQDPQSHRRGHRDQQDHADAVVRQPTQENGRDHEKGNHRAIPREDGPLGLQARIGDLDGLVFHEPRDQKIMAMAASEATTAPKASNGTMAGIGSGRPVRMLRSTRTQRTAAPAAIRMPTPITSTASQVRTGDGKASA